MLKNVARANARVAVRCHGDVTESHIRFLTHRFGAVAP
jgi:hypothetical protein